jgi:hypothetical protein
LAGKFAIHLREYTLAGRRRTSDRAAAQGRVATNAMGLPDRHANQVRHIFQTLLSAKKHNFKLIAQERSAAGDFEIAAIVADAADQREARFMALAVHHDFKLAQRIKDAGKTAHIIGKFSEGRFEIEVQVVDDLGVETGPGHAKEAARLRATDTQRARGDADGAHGGEFFGGFHQMGRHACLAGQNIGRSAR